MHFQMTYFAKHLNVFELLHQPDVTVVRSKIPDDTFNYVLATKFSSSNIRDQVANVIKLFQDISSPFSWWVSPNDQPEELIDELLAQGLSFKEENVGMYRELDSFLPLNLKVLLPSKKLIL